MPVLSIALTIAVLAAGAIGAISMLAGGRERQRLVYEAAILALLSMPTLSALVASAYARIEEALIPSLLACILGASLLCVSRGTGTGE